MGAAKYGEPPPDELRVAWHCQRWHALPEAGGIYDQDARLMGHMASLDNVYRVVERTINLFGHDIHKLTSSELRILGVLRKMQVF